MLTGKAGSGRWIRGYRRVPGGVPLHRDLHRAGNAAFIAELRSLGGTDPRILRDSEVLELILPAMRGDYTAARPTGSSPGPRCPATSPR